MLQNVLAIRASALKHEGFPELPVEAASTSTKLGLVTASLCSAAGQLTESLVAEAGQSRKAIADHQM
jgi:hypothetical protein